MGKLSKRSLKNLEGVHDDLARVVMKAAEKCDFIVTEGLRTPERQKELRAAGRSKTLNSRHLYGLAVDLCDMDGKYDIPDMEDIARAMKMAALELGIEIEWGGDWRKKPTDRIGWDSPHFELSKKRYPDKGDKKPWFAPKPGDTGKAIGGAGVATGVTVGTGAINSLPSFEQTSDLLLRSPSLRVGAVALVVGVVCYFALPRVARRLGWEV